MPTKAELESEVAFLRATIAIQPTSNYLQRVNPNLIVVMHYLGKALWLVLAVVFGVIGYNLYALGIQATGETTATLPLGISFSLKDAGPGLVVMVIALLSSLVGAVKAKVELTPEAIRLMAPPVPAPVRKEVGTKDEDRTDKHDTETIRGIENLNLIWGLTEITQLYRTPVSDLVSQREAAKVAQLQARRPFPDGWPGEVCSVVRESARFREWLLALPSRDLPVSSGRTVRVDASLPWSVRLRWGAGIADTVDIFVYTTRRARSQIFDSP